MQQAFQQGTILDSLDHNLKSDLLDEHIQVKWGDVRTQAINSSLKLRTSIILLSIYSQVQDSGIQYRFPLNIFKSLEMQRWLFAWNNYI